jgi:hypothetical protein
MSVWLVLLLIGVMLSPLAWLAPSRRQSAAMQVRLQARRMGLSMQLSRQDWPHWLERSAPTSCAQYFRARSSKDPAQWCFWQLAPGQWLDRWREPCVEKCLLEQLRELPADVYKVEAGQQLLAVYWGEKGGPEELQHIQAFILKWA